MLSSIHPLGERARHNRWSVTIAAFTVGSVAAGALAGAALGYAGGLTTWPVAGRTAVLAGAAVAAGILDLARIRPPGPGRQVNERWIGEFRGWVYGAGFGAQLGAGLATYVVTWGIYAVVVAEAMSGSAAAGASVGAAFGAGRAAAPLWSGWIDRPSRLTAFHTRMASMGPAARITAAAGLVAIGAVGLLV